MNKNTGTILFIRRSVSKIILPLPTEKSGRAPGQSTNQFVSKGVDLKANMRPCTLMKKKEYVKWEKQIDFQRACKDAGFTGKEKELQYKVPSKAPVQVLLNPDRKQRGHIPYFYCKGKKVKNVINFEVLVVKASGNEILISTLCYQVIKS
jgi:hypothetical protein